MNSKQPIRIAIIDLYDGFENQGMRCIREILNQFADYNHINLKIDEFNVRQNLEIPSLNYDIYISTGGPGSPLESEGSDWDDLYFNWFNSVEDYNNNPSNEIKKKIFLICHSFQLVCRYLGIAKVSKRKSTSFGVFPIHSFHSAESEPVFKGLKDPFYAVDSRDYQVTEPHHKLIREIGGSILAIEKARPHVPLERAIMAIRFNENVIGCQFHPEADAVGMLLHLKTPEKKETVIKNHGLEKWESMIHQLNDPDKIMFTYSHILPNFLLSAINKLEFDSVSV